MEREFKIGDAIRLIPFKEAKNGNRCFFEEYQNDTFIVRAIGAGDYVCELANGNKTVFIAYHHAIPAVQNVIREEELAGLMA